MLFPLKYEGVVTKLQGEKCFIMWTSFTNISNQVYGTMRVGPKQKIERSSASREQQAQGWGGLVLIQPRALLLKNYLYERTISYERSVWRFKIRL